MTESTSKHSAGVAAYYDRAADNIPTFTVLNYGYTDSSGTSRVPQDHPERYCLALYEHTVRDTELEGARVLEVSCGRGGGASFLMNEFGIAEYTGVDLSDETAARMQAHLDENPSDKHGKHSHRFSDTGLRAEEWRERFRGYCEYFDVIEEPAD